MPRGGRLLDIATGTGDIALEALRHDADLCAVGADFSLEMMLRGRNKPGAERIRWMGADTLALPFPNDTFDAVTSGFMLRNVIDVPRSLAEQRRVVKPGGRMVCLEISRPPRNLLLPCISLLLSPHCAAGGANRQRKSQRVHVPATIRRRVPFARRAGRLDASRRLA